jgi:hypothetical protein
MMVWTEPTLRARSMLCTLSNSSASREHQATMPVEDERFHGSLLDEPDLPHLVPTWSCGAGLACDLGHILPA